MRLCCDAGSSPLQTDEQRQRLARAFGLLDTRQSGKLDENGFREFLQAVHSDVDGPEQVCY